LTLTLLRYLSIDYPAERPVPRGLIHLYCLAQPAELGYLNPPTADFPLHCSD
jgi:hypothetical protein|tara:strand:- start:3917 stop:4072 length:156 start_codon:yes stop_codon:yes gene_type:complete